MALSLSSEVCGERSNATGAAPGPILRRREPAATPPSTRPVAEFVRVASTTEIPPGHAKAFAVGGREIAVFNVGGAFYATDGTCPHQGGPLAEGWIEGAVVTCPWHAWCFDVRTGKMTLLGDFCTIDTFEIRVIGSEVHVATSPRSPGR